MSFQKNDEPGDKALAALYEGLFKHPTPGDLTELEKSRTYLLISENSDKATETVISELNNPINSEYIRHVALTSVLAEVGNIKAVNYLANVLNEPVSAASPSDSKSESETQNCGRVDVIALKKTNAINDLFMIATRNPNRSGPSKPTEAMIAARQIVLQSVSNPDPGVRRGAIAYNYRLIRNRDEQVSAGKRIVSSVSVEGTHYVASAPHFHLHPVLHGCSRC